MINVVIPAAGRGQRFKDAGYATPKPFIELDGIPMIEWVISNVSPLENHRIILLFLREHEFFVKLYELDKRYNIVYVDEVTEGAACTVLLASHFIDNGDGLVIANSDQMVRWSNGKIIHSSLDYHSMKRLYWREEDSVQTMLNATHANKLDASIAMFKDTNPKWSFAKLDAEGLVTRVAEKNPISDNATVGVYYWRFGYDFVHAVASMKRANDRFNGEFYVCPSYNYFNGKIGSFFVDKMFGLGTPQDMESNWPLIKDYYGR